MREAEGRGETRVGAWLGGLGAALAVLITLAATLWLGFPEGTRLSTRCAPGDWEGALAEAGAAATRGQQTLALRCAYQAFLDAEAAGAGAPLVRVGDLLQSLGVQRYQKVSVRSAYLRAAEHARRAQEWPVMAAAATRLLALGELREAGPLLADVCSRTAAGAPGVPCDPVRRTATPTLFGEE